MALGPDVVVNVARLIAISLAVCVAVIWTIVILQGSFGPPLRDVEAYWNAALRLRAGGLLYPAYANDAAAEVFRYSPWFAYAWIPLTYLPEQLVRAGWLAGLAGGGLYAVSHLFNRRGVVTAVYLGATVLMGVQAGNVHPLLVALLVATVGTRLGPVGIAVAASLKGFPLLLAIVYVGRRDWRSLALTMGLTAVLVVPFAFQDLSSYPTNPERTLSLMTISPVLWGLVSVVAAAAAFGLSRTRYGWLAACVAVIAALPRLLLYDYSDLLIATKRVRRSGGG